MERVAEVLGSLDALRVELVDLAYVLERRGRRDAADVALAVAGRVGEIHEELAPPAPRRRGVSPGGADALVRSLPLTRHPAPWIDPRGRGRPRSQA